MSTEQQSEEWFRQRLGCVTGSRVADVMAKGRGNAPSATRKNYMMQLLCERLTGSAEETFTSAAMKRGTDLEPVARDAYELYSMNDVLETGFVKHPSIKWFGASPDGLVNDDGVLEIKCPNTATHIDTMRRAAHDPQYEWQMLAEMACTGRMWVDFVSFDDRMPTELQYICHRYEWDDDKGGMMLEQIQAFLSELSALENEMRDRIKSNNH